MVRKKLGRLLSDIIASIVHMAYFLPGTRVFTNTLECLTPWFLALLEMKVINIGD